jgi:IS1 family transposase
VNVLPREKQLLVLNMLVEGASLRSITRLIGVHRTTIANLMVTVGEKCRAMLDRWMKNLTLDHVELDEIWTFVQKKQGRIPVGEIDDAIGDQFVYYGIDQATKLIPCFAVGKRTKQTTDLFIEDLASRMVLPDLFGPGPHPQLSTDGYPAYRDSIDSAFAGRADHGVLIKDYRNADQPGRYGPPEMVATIRRVINGNITERSICTSHIERSNLTMRTMLRRFTRLSLGFSKKLENLIACVALYVAHYNFSRWHSTLGKTPAMAAKITGHPWTMDELLSEAEGE